MRLPIMIVATIGIAVAAMPAMAASAAQVNATAPAVPGTAQRRAILDAIRPAVEARLGTDVEFVVRRLNVRRGWALVFADPQRPGGGLIDGRGVFPDDDLEFMDGITVTAVLRFRGGRWTLVEHRFGATDVWYSDYCGPSTLPC